MKPCGTVAAYKRHYRNGETIDSACAAAHAEHNRKYIPRAPAMRDIACHWCASPIPAGRSKYCSRECRRNAALGSSPIYPRNCIECKRPFIARDPRWLCCSDTCSTERGRRRRNASTPASRNKRHRRRAVERYSDITPAYEAALRGRTRKCQLCGTYMTSKPDHPNSKHLDHIIPMGIGGTHTVGNVRIICRTCNLSRPRDGSDYTGPVTLWAQVPDVMMPALKVKTEPKPVPQPDTRRCRCGTEYPIIRSRQSLCHACVEDVGQTAASLRNEGWKWKDIAAELNYPNLGSLYSLAVRYGVVTVPRYKNAA